MHIIKTRETSKIVFYELLLFETVLELQVVKTVYVTIIIFIFCYDKVNNLQFHFLYSKLQKIENDTKLYKVMMKNCM